MKARVVSPAAGLAAALALVLAGCGGGIGANGGADGGGGGGDGGGGGQPDAAPVAQCVGQNGGWTVEDASNTPDTISNEGALTILSSGTLVIGFSEPDSKQVGDQDIWTTIDGGSGWSTAKPLTNDTAVQNTYPSIVATGDTAHLVWNGFPEGNNDIYYSTYTTSWSARANLTKQYEGGNGRHAYRPSIARGPQGQLAVAYLSSAQTVGNAEVRVGIISGTSLTGTPVTVIPATTGGCDHPSAVYDSSGDLHVVANCSSSTGDEIYYAEQQKGVWQSAITLPGNTGNDGNSPELLIDPNGNLHALWAGRESCASGTCGHLLFATRKADTGSWAPALDASMKGTPGDYWPTGAFSKSGQLMIAFHRANSKHYNDVYVTTSNDGTVFSAPCNITRKPDSDDWMPRDLQFDAAGHPHLTYESLHNGTQPVDAEVMHATLK